MEGRQTLRVSPAMSGMTQALNPSQVKQCSIYLARGQAFCLNDIFFVSIYIINIYFLISINNRVIHLASRTKVRKTRKTLHQQRVSTLNPASKGMRSDHDGQYLTMDSKTIKNVCFA